MNLGPEVVPGRVLVLGDNRHTVTVVRSLGRAGFEITLGTAKAASSTGWSRFVSDVWVYDNASPQRFRNNLEAFLRSERPDFVFPVGKSQLLPLLEVAPRLEPLSIWVNPEFDTMARCLDKRAMYELASALGVPTLPCAPFTSAVDWRRRAAAMGFPVLVKHTAPTGSGPDRKPAILADAAQLESYLAAMPSEAQAQTGLLQKFARGALHYCHVAAADGRLLAYFQHRQLRTSEPDFGAGVTGVSVSPSTELQAYCAALAKALRYTGIGCVQFLIDERACSVAFLDFKTGVDDAASLAYCMGFDYPVLAVQLAVYRKACAVGRTDAARLLPEPLPAGYAAGKSYHWLHGDLGAWVRDLRRPDSAVRSLAARVLDMAWLSLTSHHMTFDWRDPVPTLHRFWQSYRKAPLRRLPASGRASRGTRPT